MQIYIIGIGQCGTSVAFDVISELTGFVKSKEVGSLRQRRSDVEAVSNELEERLSDGLTRRIWKARIGPWLSRLWDGQGPRKAFILPQIAIVDGNPDNFVKTAFQKFSHKIVADERSEQDLRQLVSLIKGTKVLDLGPWRSGCANSMVGEAVTARNLQPQSLRANLGVDHHGNLTDNSGSYPISVFLVVSSGGGATGSGGSVYLAQTDALLSRVAKATDNLPSRTLVANAIVLPSIQASTDNKKYALNAGRALARHGNMITNERTDGKPHKPSAMILFSNPPDEGNSDALQRLNNYVAEFAIRAANFTFPGNVASIARDVDDAELKFLRGRTCVLAMSHLAEDDWYGGELESKLVERAFANNYKSDADKPSGLSVEDWPVSKEGGTAKVLSTVTSAMVAIGIPPTPDPKPAISLCIAKVNDFLKQHSGSSLDSGIRTFAYGARENLELTVFLRYRTMSTCPLAMHFVKQYIGARWSGETDSVRETDHVLARARQADHYTETFEELAEDLEDLDGTMDFKRFMLQRAATSFAVEDAPTT